MNASVQAMRNQALPAVGGYGLLWALFGVIATAFSVAIFGMWFMSDQFAAAPIIPGDTISAQMLTRIRVVEVISMLVAIGGLIWYLVLPWARHRKFTIEGLLLVGALISYVFDTTINLTHYAMAWNSHAFNFGTWGGFFPGHTGPTQYAEALFWGPPMYVYFGVVLATLQFGSLRLLQKKLGLGFGAALVGAFIVAYVFDLVVESQLIRHTEAYSWSYTIGALTLWAGEQHQFPLYEPFLVALYSSLYLWLMLDKQKDPNGLSFIERGLNFGGGMQTFARLMAATGFATVTTIMYFAGYYLFTMFADTYATLPTYLLPGGYAWPPN